MTRLELVVYYHLVAMAHSNSILDVWEIAEQLTAEDKGWA
jgi:hypothetical protein